GMTPGCNDLRLQTQLPQQVSGFMPFGNAYGAYLGGNPTYSDYSQAFGGQQVPVFPSTSGFQQFQSFSQYPIYPTGQYPTGQPFLAPGQRPFPQYSSPPQTQSSYPGYPQPLSGGPNQIHPVSVEGT